MNVQCDCEMYWKAVQFVSRQNVQYSRRECLEFPYTHDRHQSFYLAILCVIHGTPIQCVVLIYSSSAHYEFCLSSLAPSITPGGPLRPPEALLLKTDFGRD